MDETTILLILGGLAVLILILIGFIFWLARRDHRSARNDTSDTVGFQFETVSSAPGQGAETLRARARKTATPRVRQIFRCN